MKVGGSCFYAVALKNNRGVNVSNATISEYLSFSKKNSAFSYVLKVFYVKYRK